MLLRNTINGRKQMKHPKDVVLYPMTLVKGKHYSHGFVNAKRLRFEFSDTEDSAMDDFDDMHEDTWEFDVSFDDFGMKIVTYIICYRRLKVTSKKP